MHKQTSWPFVEARKILNHINQKPPSKGYVLFETGYGPSGLPHIGTFCEVARTTYVINAFKQISDIPVKLICFSDDLDGLRKIPANIPNQDLISNYIDYPLSSVPDPYEEKESFGAYMNNKLSSFLDSFGFKYELWSATECYKSGKFNKALVSVLHNYDNIMSLMLPTLGEERQRTYSPFLPICKKTGKVLQAKVLEIDKNNNTILYFDNDGSKEITSILDGNCKLQWKPDFGMRWYSLGVDYEMYGKDHMPNAHLYSSICKILGGNPPSQFFFELFLDADGKKISKSKGNSISIDEWLAYAPIESMSLYTYQSPTKAKRLYFDVIPKAVDEYLLLVEKYHLQEDEEKKKDNPVFVIHDGDVPNLKIHGLNYSLILNLVSAAHTENFDHLWGFISKYAPEASDDKTHYLDNLVHHAIKYYHDYIKPFKQYKDPSPQYILILSKILEFIKDMEEEIDSTVVQNKIYDIGMEFGYVDNLKEYFQNLYQILLGENKGPRLGSLFTILGKEESIKFLEKALRV